MGAEYMDYIIADRIVIPEDQVEFYSGRIVYLPNSYFPTSYQFSNARSWISNRALTRSDLGLPRK